MNVPDRYHSATTKLANSTGGCCVSFQYRLSPQHAFPAALIDALLVYLSLIYPAPSDFHPPVQPSRVIFAGDSAGANLALALIQVILSTNKRGEQVCFHGRTVDLPLPAGVALLSAGLDGTYALATKENTSFDVFDGAWTYLDPTFPACSIWPTNPPRGHIYSDISLMCHPLVSPCISKTWQGAPPMWFAGGQEVMAGSARLAVQVMAQEGIHVAYEEYAEMPHDFPIMSCNWPWAITEDWPQSVRCMDHWAIACLTMADGKELETKAVFFHTNGEEDLIELETLAGRSWEQAKEMMEETMRSCTNWTGTDIKDGNS